MMIYEQIQYLTMDDYITTEDNLITSYGYRMSDFIYTHTGQIQDLYMYTKSINVYMIYTCT